MTLSNRVLLLVAGLSAFAVVALTMRSPITKSVLVLRARTSLSRGDLVKPGDNVVSESVSLASFASSGVMVPQVVLPLLGRVSVIRDITTGHILETSDLAPTVTREAAGGGESVGYIHLSELIGPDTKAVAVRIDDLGSFAFALEPEDHIDVCFPDVRFLDVRVLAVGARTAKGWTAAGRRREEFATVTLAMSSTNADTFAKTIATASSARPVVLLHPTVR